MSCDFASTCSQYCGHLDIALLIARLFLGLLFFFQGYEKLFKVKISGVVEAFGAPMEAHHITKGVLFVAAAYTSIIELVCGLMLILGIFKTIALALLGVDLLMVAVAFGMIRPMWDMQHVFPRLVILIFLLVMPSCLDIFSLDHLLFCH